MKYEIRILRPEQEPTVHMATEDVYEAAREIRRMGAQHVFKLDETAVLVDTSDGRDTTMFTVTVGPRPLARY